MRKLLGLLLILTSIQINSGCKKEDSPVKELKMHKVSIRTNATYTILNGKPFNKPWDFDTTLTKGRHKLGFIITSNELILVQIKKDNKSILDTFMLKNMSEIYIDL
jgi:hypothetical protein